MRVLIFILAMAIGFSGFSQKKKWEKLFDGKSLNHWYAWKINDGSSTKGWEIVDGVLTSDGQGGDLVTKRRYGDFEFVFDFKISPKGNSGIIYKVLDKAGEKEQPYIYGPEFQIIDDVNYSGPPKDVHKTGANYDVYPPANLTAVKPAGEWNKGKIIIKDNKVEHWLNGKKIIDYEYGGEQWTADVAKSKFKKWPYATPHDKGKISLQGHGDKVWFKNIKIREL